MFDAQCDLAAVVYDEDENVDDLLLQFCAGLSYDGYRPVGLVQQGQCQGNRSLSVRLIHSNEQIELLQHLGQYSEGCRLDAGQLLNAGARVVTAIDHGADLVVINRFGRLEQEGKGLSFLIDQGISARIPVIIAVPQSRFMEWVKFSDGMSVKLGCELASLQRWWHTVAGRPRRLYCGTRSGSRTRPAPTIKAEH